ncbi:SOS response-associated peptidase [Evansella sp. LMS18]|jgi:putative SOS response-associated peptidase YedK|uniref:SOS response-associated peptidase n=1 Tax=Evansella sp. LMS18 TaxID=2924033 RepID=UPI0020D090DB|nr:SOS response-associated peptidase [Evansella sp. LMS18]UTR09721.1 SOS response-associated peptidase [Evansella sp. LMS18]
MCGRFTLYADPDFLAGYFNLENKEDLQMEASYNIAPGQFVFAVVRGKISYRGGLIKWGLIPSWSAAPSSRYKMINARSETVHEKPAFKHLIEKRRCVIPADGFYEWKQEEGEKQPYYIKMANDTPVLFAGLWDRWKSDDGESLTTCTILTTRPNELMVSLHDRMPVILQEDKWQDWVAGREASHFFDPFPSELMTAYPVAAEVNNPRNDSPSCIQAM